MSDPESRGIQDNKAETRLNSDRVSDAETVLIRDRSSNAETKLSSNSNSDAETIAYQNTGKGPDRPILSPGGKTPTFEIGSLVAGRYRILALLGSGGMGAVYKAHDVELDRVVALKVIRPELAPTTGMSQRFKQEIILARDVTHRNIVRMYDLGRSEETEFVTMEFVEGETLSTLLERRGRIPVDEAVAIMRQVCDGLAAAHENHIVHRDLKPANIMCDPKGRVIIMDFGLARDTAADHLTRTGEVLGTIDYMSPEQSRGQTVDARSDLFAVGLILYELLTGTRPFSAESAVVTLIKRSRERARPPSTIEPTLPHAVDDIVMRCLETDPDNRYQAATEIIADLEAWQHGTHVSFHTIARRWQARVHWWHAAAAAFVAVIVLGVLFLPRLGLKPVAPHPTMSVLVADFTNRTDDPVFDGTLEPMINVALEGAGFVSAFNRGYARDAARQLPKPSDTLDEESALLVAISKSISTVIVGEIGRNDNKYTISARALDSVNRNVLAKEEVTAASKDEVLLSVPRLIAPIRKALGDTTPESVQIEKSTGAFTAASLETVQQYGIGMEQQSSGKMEEALQSFSNAVKLDPDFARAYSGMAGAYQNLRRLGDAEKYAQEAMRHLNRLSERERFRVRGAFYIIEENWQKCMEEYSEVVSQYPADNIGHNNLGLCYSKLRELDRSIEVARNAVENQPESAGWRVNLSLFSCYKGDFQACENEAREALRLNPNFEYGFMALAFAQLGQGKLSAAAETYYELEKINPSWAAAGLADLALYEGRFADAQRILEQGAAADEDAKNLDAMADKLVTLAHIELSQRNRQPALEAAEKALSSSQSSKIKFLVAQIFVEAGELTRARELAAQLTSGPSGLSDEHQALAKIIEGESALKEGDVPGAVNTLVEAKNKLDTWIGRFELGRAYLEGGGFGEADSEFDHCIARRGEALSLFLDEAPTYGYFPPVYYYQGRVREGLKSSGFAESYRTYLDIRGKAGEDPLLPKVRQRAGRE